MHWAPGYRLPTMLVLSIPIMPLPSSTDFRISELADVFNGYFESHVARFSRLSICKANYEVAQVSSFIL